MIHCSTPIAFARSAKAAVDSKADEAMAREVMQNEGQIRSVIVYTHP